MQLRRTFLSWNSGTDEDRIMPTARVTDLPVMQGIKRDGFSAMPLEPDGTEVSFDERYQSHLLHLDLTNRRV